MNTITRETAWGLLTKYNKEPFHQHHAVTVEGVMRYYAEKIGEDPDFWGICGLLHDVDFEQWPEEHCTKAPELLAEIQAPEEMVHAICSHGYGLCCDREVIRKGAEMLGWELTDLFQTVLEAMQSLPDPEELDARNGIEG